MYLLCYNDYQMQCLTLICNYSLLTCRKSISLMSLKLIFDFSLFICFHFTFYNSLNVSVSGCVNEIFLWNAELLIIKFKQVCHIPGFTAYNLYVTALINGD